MFAKKVPVDIRTAWRSKAEQVELEKLYARRAAIDTLIESLEDYARYRAIRPYDRKLKMA